MSAASPTTQESTELLLPTLVFDVEMGVGEVGGGKGARLV